MEASTKRAKRLLTAEDIASAMSWMCDCNCAENWRRRDLAWARASYLTLPLTEQLLCVYDVLASFRNTETKVMQLTIGGIEVCRAAFCLYHGISDYQFYAALNCLDSGTHPRDIHGNSERDYCRAKQEHCAAYLQRTCDELAEGLPTGFRLELNQRVCNSLSPLILDRWPSVIYMTCTGLSCLNCVQSPHNFHPWRPFCMSGGEITLSSKFLGTTNLATVTHA